MKTNVHLNMQYHLGVAEGDYADKTSMSNQWPDPVYIGSEIDPVFLGSSSSGDVENGMSVELSWYLIVQHGKPMLVESRTEAYNYGCDYMRNGGREDYEVFDLSRVENLEIERPEQDY